MIGYRSITEKNIIAVDYIQKNGCSQCNSKKITFKNQNDYVNFHCDCGWHATTHTVINQLQQSAYSEKLAA